MLKISAMSAAVSAGEAERLFADDPIGPVRYRGTWWAVPVGGSAFEPVMDPAVLDRAAMRLQAARDASG
jgi:hypothetical protein